ncbi:microtubule-associated protein [Anaeramoeba flamelloides]|uniref:Microtubule-associated protein n=1 Tax=Anaeramoeba flamelloides TaxID=1746091 RepID=A0AAV7YBS6_9EUKA|nr:microtubule-associated protein [Anaeramoeba flamelloides]
MEIIKEEEEEIKKEETKEKMGTITRDPNENYSFEYLSLHEYVLPKNIYCTQHSLKPTLTQEIESQLSQWKIASGISLQTFTNILKHAVVEKYKRSSSSRLLFDAVCLKFLIAEPSSTPLIIGSLGKFLTLFENKNKEQAQNQVKIKIEKENENEIEIEKEKEKEKTKKEKEKENKKKEKKYYYSEKVPPFSDILSEFLTLRQIPKTNSLHLFDNILEESMKWKDAFKSFLTDLLIHAPDYRIKKFLDNCGVGYYCDLIANENNRHKTFQLFGTGFLPILSILSQKEMDQKNNIKQTLSQYFILFLSNKNSQNSMTEKYMMINKLFINNDFIAKDNNPEKEQDSKLQANKLEKKGYTNENDDDNVDNSIMDELKNINKEQTKIEMEEEEEEKDNKNRKTNLNKLEKIKLEFLENIISNTKNEINNSNTFRNFLFPTLITVIRRGNKMNLSKVLFQKIINNQEYFNLLFQSDKEIKRYFEFFSQYPDATKMWFNSWEKKQKVKDHFSKNPDILIKLLRYSYYLNGFENEFEKYFHNFLLQFNFSNQLSYVVTIIETLLDNNYMQPNLLIIFFSIALEEIPQQLQQIIGNIFSRYFVSTSNNFIIFQNNNNNNYSSSSSNSNNSNTSNNNIFLNNHNSKTICVLVSKLRFLIEKIPNLTKSVIGSIRNVSFLINILETNTSMELMIDSFVLIKYFIKNCFDHTQNDHINLLYVILLKIFKLIDGNQMQALDLGFANSLFETILKSTKNIQNPDFVKKILYLFWNRKVKELNFIELINQNYYNITPINEICKLFLLQKINNYPKNDCIKFKLLEILINFFPNSLPKKIFTYQIITSKILKKNDDVFAFFRFLLACCKDRQDIIQNHLQILKLAANPELKGYNSSQISELARIILETCSFDITIN